MKHSNTALLDLALADRSAQTRARVLELVLKLGVSPDDEFWLILIALKSLEVLMLDAPKEWTALFDTFTGDLDSWSQQMLLLLDRKAKTTANHSRATRDQTRLLTELVAILMQQTNTWQTAAHGSTVLANKFTTFSNSVTARLEAIEHSSARTQQHLIGYRQSMNWIGNANSFIVMLALLFGLLAGFWLGQQTAISNTSQKPASSLSKLF